MSSAAIVEFGGALIQKIKAHSDQKEFIEKFEKAVEAAIESDDNLRFDHEEQLKLKEKEKNDLEFKFTAQINQLQKERDDAKEQERIVRVREIELIREAAKATDTLKEANAKISKMTTDNISQLASSANAPPAEVIADLKRNMQLEFDVKLQTEKTNFDAERKKMDDKNNMTEEELKTCKERGVALQTVLGKLQDEFAQVTESYNKLSVSREKSTHENHSKMADKPPTNKKIRLLIGVYMRRLVKYHKNMPDNQPNKDDADQFLKLETSVVEIEKMLRFATETIFELALILGLNEEDLSSYAEVKHTTSEAHMKRKKLYKGGVWSYESICGRSLESQCSISEESLISSDKATCIPEQYFVNAA